MSINIASNFLLSAQLPLDARTVVADIAARNAIAAVQRYEGLIVYVVSEATNYQLQGGILDANWVNIANIPPAIVGTYYINTESGNDANDGTIGSPFLTVQHAVDLACPQMYGNTDAFVFNITNDGVVSFTENVLIPENAKGYYKFVGKTAADPTDTVWLGGGDLNGCLKCTNPGCVIDVDAIRFNNSGVSAAILVEQTNLIIRYCLFNGNKVGIDADYRSFVYFVDEADGDTSMLNDSSNTSIGVYAKNDSWVRVNQSLTVLLSDYTIAVVDGGGLITQDGELILGGGIAGGSDDGIYLWNTDCQLAADMQFDLDTATSQNACVFAYNSFFWITANLSFIGANAHYGFKFEGNTTIHQSVGGAYAYGTTVRVSLEPPCVMNAVDNLDALLTQIEFFDQSTSIYANDHRYLAAAAQNTGVMEEGKLLGQLYAIAAATPTALFVPTANRNTIVRSLIVTNTEVSSGKTYSIYHDDNGSTANDTTNIASNIFIAPGDTHIYSNFYINDTSGRVMVEDVSGTSLTFSAYGPVNYENLNVVYKMLGQTRPANTTPVAMFNPTTTTQTRITDIYIVNRNVDAQSFRIGIDDTGSTLDANSARFWDYTIQKNEVIHISNETWMNDVSGTFLFRSSVANDLTCTVYGIERYGLSDS